MCRKRSFAIHGRGRRPAPAAVCRIPCLILCLANVERVCLCRRITATTFSLGLLGRSSPDSKQPLPYTLYAMTSAEIAAYIGATAWLPPIAFLLYRWLRRPVLTIVPEQAPELGFTSHGTICNLRLAFIAEHKDLILDDLALDVVHENAERRALRWAGVKEDLGETRDAAGVKQGQLTREHPPTALRIATVGPMIRRFP